MEMTDLKNVSFELFAEEHLPFADAEFDVVISNGTINLIPDKARLLKEILRVIKPVGRLMWLIKLLSEGLIKI